MNKPKMSECRVFYIDIGNMHSSEIDEFVLSFKNILKESFDTSGVIFVPIRGERTGWQYPQFFPKMENDESVGCDWCLWIDSEDTQTMCGSEPTSGLEGRQLCDTHVEELMKERGNE